MGYLEAKHQKPIQIADLFKTFSTLPRQSGLKQSVQWWNQINFWVAGEILTQPTAKSQLTILTKFLNVAVELFRLRNYSTCSQILTGITHNTVQRIKILQSIIPKESRDILANLKLTRVIRRISRQESLNELHVLKREEKKKSNII